MAQTFDSVFFPCGLHPVGYPKQGVLFVRRVLRYFKVFEGVLRLFKVFRRYFKVFKVVRMCFKVFK